MIDKSVHVMLFFYGCSSGLYKCIEGDIRLSNGLSLEEGMVEMCVNGSFLLLVEYVSWTYQNSFVTCRQLGLHSSGTQHSQNRLQ